MKNFALLLSSLAVASSAVAAAPEVNSQLEKMSKSSVEPVQLSCKQATFGKSLSKGSLVKTNRIQSKAPAKVEGLNVSYEEPEGLFALGMSETRRGFSGFSYRRGPAYFPLTWKNTSTGATEFEWEMISDYENHTTSIYKTYDFERSEVWCTEDGPVLYGMDAEGNGKAFQIGAENVSDMELSKPNIGYFFGGDCVLDTQSGTDYGMSTYMFSQNAGGYIGVDFMQYSLTSKDVDPKTHLDPIFTSEQGFGFVDPQFVGFCNYFHAPAAPYLITKMWCWMNLTVNKPTVVNMTLYKMNGGYMTEDVIASGSLSVSPTDKFDTLPFELFTLDEDDLETDDPVVIDCDFMAVMTFNNEDIDQVYPVCGGGANFPATSETNPFYANGRMLLIENGGPEDAQGLYYIRPPYAFFTDNTRTEMAAVTDWLWMVDATYPWTRSADGVTEVNVPAEGGVASFNIDTYFGLQYFNYEVPDWIDFENANITINQELRCQVLNLPVNALPAGVEGRSAEVKIDGIGTQMTVVVTQGKVDAVSTIVVDKNAEYFDLQGRRVANPEKGLYIKKSGNKAEKVIL
ncbi:MAG: hypothetical protein K2K98_10155 [Muribaculaceae bacterium]|nr:hypothetical protein [Muribaculaceae bacterium]